jgi:hypothetical protein
MDADRDETQETRRDYRAYLVRFWRDGENAPWRASITHVVGGESHQFASRQMVWRHIQKQLGREAGGEEGDGS